MCYNAVEKMHKKVYNVEKCIICGQRAASYIRYKYR